VVLKITHASGRERDHDSYPSSFLNDICRSEQLWQNADFDAVAERSAPLWGPPLAAADEAIRKAARFSSEPPDKSAWVYCQTQPEMPDEDEPDHEPDEEEA
jgi:hypothetical protein